jgi:hypothetical protein
MAKSGSERPFEVYCHPCKVTFSAESRHCIHCGGRLSRDPLVAGSFRLHQLAVAAVEDSVPIELEEETPRRSPFSPVAILWIVLLAAGSIYRACTGA